MAKKQQKLQAAHAQETHWQSRAQDADPPNTPSTDSASSDLESGLEIDATGYEGGVSAQAEWRKAEWAKSWMDGLLMIEKLLKSKTTHFVGGPSSLQAKQTCAITSYLALVVHKNHCQTVALQLAAESHGFARMTLLLSLTGHHTKTYSLLSDPGIATELWTYMQSNEWAINPEKLTTLTKNQLIPAEAEKYVHQITANKMPNGLRQYMELELFPQIHLKVSKGISLMTVQSHDSTSHDVICSTVGHLVEAGQSLEYGKNYDGYWNGELFVNQLKEKIIPAFERIHGAGYQALFFIDNSQGHSAYAEDALLASCMNVNPDGWYQKDGVTVVQKMVFSQDHPMHAGEPKGIKKYIRDNCNYSFDTLKANLPLALKSVKLRTIHLWEHCTHHWMEAYQSGLGTKEEQLQVQKFSSTKYKSHQ
ncbi:hypothetical protein PISMIDRAFT_28841 [Pisolithus microcarpus 441]|uniref:DDE-1 domain-containing protein n=1 Tax=Pisolithus microcarpus 441 TaxID=765257 RepID=A0A0C9YJZ0_9AGAM|nr:hypothetical protein BKA83DRAFT_28841 [Pisolithus microcarpus]KIK25275.1 hypothetical protein PISMIDRAFT_28841 [Pisolithus microcarpus 441]